MGCTPLPIEMIPLSSQNRGLDIKGIHYDHHLSALGMHQVSSGQLLLVKWVLGEAKEAWESLKLVRMIEYMEFYM